jgi:hypothetical protein
MRHILSTLACSGLLGIAALYSAPAIADAAGQAPHSLSAKPATDGQIWNLSCTTAACQGKIESAVLMRRPGEPGGVQLVRGGMGGGGIPHGGGGGFHGGGGFGGFHGGGGFGGFPGGGMGGFHGMGDFHGHRFIHGRRFGNDNFFFDNDGGAFFGFGLPYSYCDPYYYNYYGVCYPGYGY